MITHISIKDFAIIKDLSLDLYPGLNIITGETGAGKSIIIQAVSMALGARADTDYIRTGAEKAYITLIAESDDERLPALMDEMGIPADMPLIIKREISIQGRSICRVNGSIVPLSDLVRLCRLIADIHGQYDHQSLLDTDTHVDVLDRYAGKEAAQLREKTAASYGAFLQASSELEKLKKALADAKRQQELLLYETGEIDAAGLNCGEDEELEEEISVMQHSEQIFAALEEAGSVLFGSSGAYDSLGTALDRLQSVSNYSKDAGELAQTVADSYYQIEDIRSGLRKLRDSVSFSEEELNEKAERLELIRQLKRKYGGSIEAVLEYGKRARQQLSGIQNADERISQLEASIAGAKADYIDSARRLTEKRKVAASLLESKIDAELAQLAFHDARFSVRIKAASPSARGSDEVEFMIATNKGEEARPLAKIASGGELSRIMLAMKQITGEADGIPTMIFDEIDTGISGATAGVVGNKLESIADAHQIICITHLPQIACKGQHHYRITKSSDEISTQTTVTPLNEEERIREIARLLSGTTVSDAAIAQAKELLKN